jgi:hypothetical protein
MYRYIWSPIEVNPKIFYIFFLFTLLLSIAISVLFHAVVIDEQSIKTNSLIQIQHDADLFVLKLKNNETNLYEQFEWIKHFSFVIKQNCTLVPKSVQMIRICSSIFAFYNSIMMHFLLQGKLPVTIKSVLPILLSLIGTSISPSNIIFFGIIELMQAIIAVTIISVSFFSLSFVKK